jgi:hypothetical protein
MPEVTGIIPRTSHPEYCFRFPRPSCRTRGFFLSFPEVGNRSITQFFNFNRLEKSIGTCLHHFGKAFDDLSSEKKFNVIGFIHDDILDVAIILAHPVY